MKFTGQITNVKPVSGENKYHEQYQGVELTVVEPKQGDQWNNKATVYISNATAEAYHVGESIDVEVEIDIKMGNTGRAFNSVKNVRMVTPQTF